MVSGKISAGEAYVMVSCETEKLEQGLRDVHQKLERETERIAAANRQLELEFKVDGVEDFKDELHEVKNAVDASSASATKWAIACSTIVPTMWNGMKNADYGDSALSEPVFFTGLSPSSLIAVRAGDKINRLRKLLYTTEQHVGETVDDTILDLAGYCILWLCALENERNSTE